MSEPPKRHLSKREKRGLFFLFIFAVLLAAFSYYWENYRSVEYAKAFSQVDVITPLTPNSKWQLYIEI